AYIPGSDVLLLAGDYHEFLPGQGSLDRRVWAAKVGATTGQLPNEGGNGCALSLEVISQEVNAGGYQTVGTMGGVGAVTPVGFNTDQPVFPATFCSYADAIKGDMLFLPPVEALQIKPRHLRLQYQAGSVDQADLLDLWGRVVRSRLLPAGTSELDWQFPDLAKGIYLLRLSQGSTPVNIQKISVQP
ncbi:MAG: hypothetical protein AAFV07_04805, partial [Bacteroidota bacterium]